MKNLLARYALLPKAVKASLWFTLCSILQKGISFITIPIFTRMLSVEEYGVIALFSAWQGILCIFATLNLSFQIFNNGMIKFEKDRAGYTTAMLGLSNFATIILFMIYWIFHAWLDVLFNLPPEAMLLMFSGFLFSAATSLWTVQQRYLFEYRLVCLITLGLTFGSAVLGVIFVYFRETGVSRIFANTIAEVIVGAGIYCLLLNKDKKLIHFIYWRYALKLDLPLIPHYLSMMVLGNSDRIMIGNMCGKAVTALYSVPYNASVVMWIIITSINATFIPWIYQKCKAGEFRNIKEVSSFLLILVMVITLLPSLFAPELVWILGADRYRESMWVVPPVSCSVFFIFVYSLFSNIELFYEKSQNIMIASLCAAVGNVMLNYIFIPRFGYLAAAYTTLVCYILLAVMHYYFMMDICKDKRIQETIYNTRLIISLSAFLVIYSLGVTLLFDKPWWIRYAGLALILCGVVCKRESIRRNFELIREK